MQRVAYGGGQHLGAEALHAIDLADVADQVHAHVRDVVQAAEEGADVVRAGLGREQRLGRREAQRLIDADAAAGQVLNRLEPVLREGTLHHHVVGDLAELLGFLHHALEIGGHHLQAHVARRRRLTDLLDQRTERALLLGDQRWVGGDAVQESHLHGFLDLTHARGIEKDFHRLPHSFPDRSRRTRVPARTEPKTLGSPITRPTTFTGLSGRISSPWLAGVGPKKMQKARPGGQYARSPSSTTARGDSAPSVRPMPKYTSSPHVSALASRGSASQMACAVREPLSVAWAFTPPAVMWIVRPAFTGSA